jgi:Asp-tRNA(Asn)/Glu-tRNA(Gln) amidotransferase B subunit
MITKLLRQLDFSEPQAEVLSELIKQNNICAEKIADEKILNHREESEKNLDELVSKRDLFITQKELELQIEKVRSEIEKVRSEIEKVRSDLIRWVAGLMIANTGLLFTLIKFFN